MYKRPVFNDQALILKPVIFKLIHFNSERTRRLTAVLVPERGNVTSWSDKYLYYARGYVTRTSRKSPYYINVEGKTKHTWGNNVTAHLIFYEYLHNEYRRTFIEAHLRGCDVVNKDPFIGQLLRDRGYSCPHPPADFHLLNITVPMDAFRYTIPFEKFRVEAELTHTDTKESIAKAYGYASLKPKYTDN
ncbi:unnamed protein product [Diatraea saccharalis]|uniref:Uncharacterized protein n=1 Tax=Diatraea saccharalis TaxID=40085 RepID=A0A9N9WIL8_9NEOP|nr:unnamed protein product [Diatraea saccharalis]